MERKERDYRRAFRKVMTHYDELRSMQGKNFANRTTARVVNILPEDFFADVELSAKKALSVDEYRLFKLVYIDKECEASEAMLRDTKHTIQDKVGRMWQGLGIFPMDNYMKKVDCR